MSLKGGNMQPARETTPQHDTASAGEPIRLGVVSFLNAVPLYEGLHDDPTCDLRFEVPSKLADLLDRGEVDAASVPIVDYLQRTDRWQVVGDGCIASDGPTLTVRVFSHVPASEISLLHLDGDSHTSVVLAQLLWRGWFKHPVDIAPLPDGALRDECEAVLLIGDKVVAADTAKFAYDVDLGGAWREWTGLPMVFAFWAAGHRADAARIERCLNAARDRGIAAAAALAEARADRHGWNVRDARRYLTQILQYRMTDRHRAGVRKFHELATEFGLLPANRNQEAAPAACTP